MTKVLTSLRMEIFLCLSKTCGQGPGSNAQVASRLHLDRQDVHYHLSGLCQAGLLVLQICSRQKLYFLTARVRVERSGDWIHITLTSSKGAELVARVASPPLPTGGRSAPG